MYLSGILLAGGASKRFKSNKLRSKIGPIPLYINQLIKLFLFCDEIIISSNRKSSKYISRDLFLLDRYLSAVNIDKRYLKDCEIRLIIDEQVKDLGPEVKDIGPVLGLYNGLVSMKADTAIVTAFDMPLISYRLLELLKGYAERLKDKKAAIIKREKGFESLCGIYRKEFSRHLKYNINRGEFKISLSYNDADVKTIKEEALQKAGIDSLNFFNINKVEDFNNFNDIFYGEVKEDDTDCYDSGFGRKWQDYFYRKAY